MNKKILAVAVATALAAPLAAQAGDINFYGKAQVELQNTKTDGAPVIGTNDVNKTIRNLIDDGPDSRFGFNASEDLGDGLTGIAHMDWLVDVANGATNELVAREHYVGLSGGFGTVIAGRIQGVYKTTNLDPYISTTLEARNLGGQSSGNFGHNGFINNMIKYSNKFGQVTFSAMLNPSNADAGSAGGNSGNGDFQADLSYKGGPLRALIAYSKNKEAGGANTPDEKRTKIAGQYTMGPHQFTAQYETIKDYTPGNIGGTRSPGALALLRDSGVIATATGTNPGDLGDAKFWYLAYDFDMGNMNDIYLRYGQEKYNDLNDAKNTAYALAFRHKMSKTMNVWVGYFQQKWKDTGTYEPKTSTFTVGMVKNF